ncbi:chitin deacetylase 8-like [Paramacrobiotus metropolitanus]|uniref:chitin deacetylase 8-like n=1 Tax=Paramacrobiotus metropolitanus TaxID=2943436 RepID=UPI002445B93E|nr:chitin deacetylase 8-like [Paramacrobiotus metropolitanus]
MDILIITISSILYFSVAHGAEPNSELLLSTEASTVESFSAAVLDSSSHSSNSTLTPWPEITNGLPSDFLTSDEGISTTASTITSASTGTESTKEFEEGSLPPAPTTPFPDTAPTDPPLPEMARPCDQMACRLPFCYCQGYQIPGGLSANDTPQMVLTTFDGAINMHNYPLYTQMYHNERVNPNGCPVRATFFVSHRWTDYSNVQNLYATGHEIALRGVALTGDQLNATYENFTEDIVAFQQIAKNFADVDPQDMVGQRAPYLKTAGDDQFLAAFDAKLLYDASILNPNTTPVWPFTLDYATPFQCPEWYPPCPLLSYPGLWEIPATRMVGPTGIPYGFYSAYEFPKNPIEVAEVLMKFFKAHYEGNRAPFTLNGLSYWFGTAEYRLGFELFLEQLLRLPDVWIVTASQLISWMQRPTPLSSIKDFPAFKCDRPRTAQPCDTGKTCRTFLEGEEIYFSTCKRCPFTFPYLKNYNGCFNDPCPTPIVEYADSVSALCCSYVVHVIMLLLALSVAIKI